MLPAPGALMRFPRCHSLLLPTILVGLIGCSKAGGGVSTPGPEGPRADERTPESARRGTVLYAPASARFRIDSRDSLAMEMPDGSFQRTVTVKAAFVTISLRPIGNELAAEISLDSLILDRPNPMVQPLVDSAQGGA